MNQFVELAIETPMAPVQVAPGAGGVAAVVGAHESAESSRGDAAVRIAEADGPEVGAGGRAVRLGPARGGDGPLLPASAATASAARSQERHQDQTTNRFVLHRPSYSR